MRIPIAATVILFLFSILIDLYIAFDVKSSFHTRKAVRWYWVSAVACWIFLIVILCLPRRNSESGFLPVMWMLFSYLSIYIGKLGYIFSSAIGRLVNLIFRLKTEIHPFRFFGVLFGISLCGILWGGVYYTRHHIMVVREDFASTKLPTEFNGFKIVQISDLHVGTWGNDTTFLSSLVDSVNAQQPDLIVFTGDIVNRQTSELTPFKSTLSRLKARYGVYSILGNHDYGDYVDWEKTDHRNANNDLLAQYEREMGWQLLNNKSKVISSGNDSIILIGVEKWGEPPFPTYGDLNSAIYPSPDSMINQNDGNFKILLSHNPEHWNREVSKNTNINLTLSGHTHAMQTMVKIGNWKWSPAKYRYEQWGGRYDRNNKNGEPTTLYVNIGAGSVGMPTRLLGAFPEITVITLKDERQ